MDLQKKTMASNSESKIDEHAGGDQQERDVIVTDVLSSVEDQHFHFINEKGDMSNSIACDVTKELIARESKHNIAQSSEPATRSSYTLSTIMSTRNSCNHDSTLRSAESSDSESLIDEGQIHCFIFSSNLVLRLRATNRYIFFCKRYFNS